MSSKLFWLTSLAFLFYVPLESCTAGWATTLIVSQSPSGEEEKTKKLAAWGLSGFWLCFMGSRLVVSLMGEEAITGIFGEHKEYAMLLTGAVACVVLMIVLVVMRGRGMAFAAVVLAGLIFGPVFPAMMTLVLKGVDPAAMGRAVGFFFLFGSVGWTAIPMLIGNVAKKSNIQRGFIVGAASSVLFLIMVLSRGTGVE